MTTTELFKQYEDCVLAIERCLTRKDGQDCDICDKYEDIKKETEKAIEASIRKEVCKQEIERLWDRLGEEQSDNPVSIDAQGAISYEIAYWKDELSFWEGITLK